MKIYNKKGYKRCIRYLYRINQIVNYGSKKIGENLEIDTDGLLSAIVPDISDFITKEVDNLDNYDKISNDDFLFETVVKNIENVVD